MSNIVIQVCAHLKNHQSLLPWGFIQTCSYNMMTSSNGNIFCVIGPLQGNPSVTGGFPHTGQWRGISVFLWSAFQKMFQQTIEGTVIQLRRHRTHYDVTVMRRFVGVNISNIDIVIQGFKNNHICFMTYHAFNADSESLGTNIINIGIEIQ